jgi:tryptophan-rich sensory protein
MTLKSAGRLVLCLLLCLGVGVIQSVVTRPEIPTWYAELAKPFWTPPSIAFPVVWTILYILMAISLWRLWDRAPPSAARMTAIGWFFAQLALNAAWSPLFFGWHGIQIALAVIVALLIAIAMTIVTTSRIDHPAAWLLVPYLIWVGYATTINAGVVAMNDFSS